MIIEESFDFVVGNWIMVGLWCLIESEIREDDLTIHFCGLSADFRIFVLGEIQKIVMNLFCCSGELSQSPDRVNP